MKCSIMLHFIWAFTVCQSTHLGVSSIQKVTYYEHCIPKHVYLFVCVDALQVFDQIIVRILKFCIQEVLRLLYLQENEQ